MLVRALRYAAALLLCGTALLLPYGARSPYGRAVAAAAHAPFILFGLLARAILDRVDGEGGGERA